MKSDKRLESQMVKYTDLLSILTYECGEALISLDSVPYGYLSEMADMKKICGDRIMVRKTVGENIMRAQSFLKEKNKRYSLYVTYGYRTTQIQTMRFLKRLRAESIRFYPSANELYEAVHRSVAVPTVAGHPTGGAVDLYIMDTKTGVSLDFGSKMYDYSDKKYYVYSSRITNEQMRNRMLLRSVMMRCGFAPFDGEWWHFSYGDKEWAYYYGKNCTLYSTLLE